MMIGIEYIIVRSTTLVFMLLSFSLDYRISNAYSNEKNSHKKQEINQPSPFKFKICKFKTKKAPPFLFKLNRKKKTFLKLFYFPFNGRFKNIKNK